MPIREIKDPINAQGLEDLIYNFEYLYRQIMILSGGQDVEQLLEELERLIREANEALESYEVLEPRLITAAENAETQAEAARLQAEYVASVKPSIDYFIGQQTNLQAQINQLVVSGDSSPEAAQARVGVDGFASPTLKASIDRQINALSKSTQNLLLNTISAESFVIGSATSGGTTFSTLTEVNGSIYYRLEVTGGNNITRIVAEQPNTSRYRTFENGKTYTISYLARSNRTNLNTNYSFVLNVPAPNMNVSPNTPLSTDWKLHTRTFTWNLGDVASKINLGMEQANGLVPGDYFEFKNVMINEGVLPLPFYPNYLDLKKLFDETYLFKTSSVVDFNQLTIPGNYLLVGANGLVNAPNNTHNYYVTIYNRSGNDFATQFAKRVGTGEYFTRTQTTPNSTTWTEWQPITIVKATTAQAQNGTDDLTYMTPLKVVQSTQRNSLARRGSIPNTDDFNNYTTAGIYRCTFEGQFAANFPSSAFGYGNLIVFRSDNEANTTINQFYIPDSTGQFFFRSVYLNSVSGWRPWRKVATTLETGDLNALGTNEKSSLVAAINEVLQSVSNFKSTIAGAITDRGINTPATANSTTMANNIALIGQPRQASGLVNVVTESLPFSFYDMSATEDSNYVTVSGLNFRPRRIVVFNPNAAIPNVTEYSFQLAVLDESIRIYKINGAQITTVVSNFRNNTASAFVNNGGFRLPVDGSGNGWEWYAYEY